MTRAPAEKSTTVRFPVPPALRAARPALRALEAVAPGAAIRLAARLWCTPPRSSARARARSAGARSGGSRPAGGLRGDVTVNGRRVAVESWPAIGAVGAAEAPLICLVHGWGGWRGQLDPFVEPLRRAGHRVASFDALGHGDSQRGAYGRRTTLAELADTVAGVLDRLGPVHGVVAHSLGGTATLLAALDRPGGFGADRLVAIAVPVEPLSYIDAFAAALGFGRRVREGLPAGIERIVRRPATDVDLAARLRARGSRPGALPPVLLVHDRDDNQARYADAPPLAAAWPDGELLTTGGLGHRRILRDPYVIDQTVAYLAPPAAA